MKMYEKYMDVLFSVKGNLKNIPQINEFLREFRRELEGIKIREESLFIRPLAVDNFAYRQDDNRTLICSQQIKWVITDDKPGWSDRANAHVCPLISKNLVNFERSSRRIRAKVLAVHFSGLKSRIWPSQSLEASIL